ncbi:glycosyl hydrolase, partial [Flavobacterium bomense]
MKTKKTATTLLLMISIFGFSQQKSKIQPKSFSTKDKIITVYTSADSTNLRLSKTDNLTFSDLKQPVETQVCIF